MSLTLWMLQGGGLIALLMGSAFFSSSETALFSLNALHIERIRKRHAIAASRIDTLLHQPKQLLSTILIGNTLVNVFCAALGYLMLRSMNIHYAELVAVPMMTFLLLLLGEVIPKRLAIRKTSQIAVLYAAPLSFLLLLFTPARFLLEQVGRLFEQQLRKDNTRSTLSEDEFLTVVEVGEEEGVLNEEERTMVDGIIRLEETQASDVMTPRVDLIGIDLEDTPEEQLAAAHSCRFHFLPLYRETMDHIEGLLDVTRFLLSGSSDMSEATIKPHFVPENAALDTLLTEFQREHRRVAIVSDEFGGTAGLITRGDILEEIADDVENEFGVIQNDIKPIGSDTWLIAGSVSLEDINYELDLELEADGADRIAGWVTAQIEHIPSPGEFTEAQGCRVTVLRVRRQRILTVKLEKLANHGMIDAGEDFHP